MVATADSWLLRSNDDKLNQLGVSYTNNDIMDPMRFFMLVR